MSPEMDFALRLAPLVVSGAALWFARRDKDADRAAGLGRSLDALRVEFENHRIEAARTYVGKNDLAPVLARVEALVERIDRLVDGRS